MYDILQTGEAGVAKNTPFAVPPGNPDERIPNLVVEPLPTEADWQDLFAKAQQALASGSLTMDQYAYLKIIDNMKQAWAYLSVQQKRNDIKKSQMQQMADQANTERQMMSNQQAQMGKEKLEQLKIFGNVIQEYAKAAFANPMNNQNPDIILQKIQIEMDKMYGNTNAGNEQQPAGPGQQQPEQYGEPAPAGGELPDGGEPVQGYESDFGGGELQ
jgi:hypothetical protein